MKAKGWVEALTSRSRVEVAEVEGSVVTEVLWKGSQEIPAELWHYPSQEACPFYAVCVFLFPYWKILIKKKLLKETKERSFCLGFSCVRGSVYARGWVWQQKKSEQHRMGRRILKKNRSAVFGWLFLGGEFPPTALFCFYSLENSVFFSFEAIKDLMLSAAWVNDETWLMCRP